MNKIKYDYFMIKFNKCRQTLCQDVFGKSSKIIFRVRLKYILEKLIKFCNQKFQ